MNDDLLEYYQREMSYLRALGAEYAENYPDVARRLRLEPDRCADPHVERLLEGFAFLTARIRRKLDDEYPEIAQAYLEMLAPHLLRPIPSLTVAHLENGPDPKRLAEGHTLPRGTGVVTLRPVEGHGCTFRTTQDVTLWPLAVSDARLSLDRIDAPDAPRAARSLLRISMRCEAPTDLGRIGKLRLYLNGPPEATYPLYEGLLRDVCEARVVAGGRTIALKAGALQPVGFEADQAALPLPLQSFPASLLLLEYFAFPEKFLFVDVDGWKALSGPPASGEVELQLFLSSPPRVKAETAVTAETFKLGCVPIINLFGKPAEPLRLTQSRAEYRIVPDVHKPLATEIHSIDKVSSWGSYLAKSRAFEPFYSTRHALAGPQPDAYWHATRYPSGRPGDDGTELDIAFVDLDFRPTRPASETILIDVTCTNRGIPPRMKVLDRLSREQGDFQVQAQAPIGKVRALRTPTKPLRPSLGRSVQWRLISTLSMNHLSLVSDPRGVEALREALRIHDFARSDVTRQLVQGVAAVGSRRVAGRLPAGARGGAVAMGVEATVTFDESRYVGSGAYLLAMVLERFLGNSASINGFSKLTARSLQREGVIQSWPPRAGERTLL